MSDLRFIPRRLVSTYQAAGWRPVPGYVSPPHWAVLMEQGSVGPLPEPKIEVWTGSNISRAARGRNLKRYAGAE